MGAIIDRDAFAASDYPRFGKRLRDSIEVLRETLARPGFGAGAPSIGAELEAYIVDERGRVALLNQALVDALDDPRLQLELNRFNIEYNLAPLPLSGGPLQALERQLIEALSRLESAAAAHRAHVVPIGILPTLRRTDLGEHAMSDLPRYRALEQGLKRMRGAPFDVEIRGEESVRVSSDHVVLEGANTSFQLHLRVPPERFAATYNTAQIVTPLVLALSANSPLFLQRRLWDETRIALFKQAVDCRMRGADRWQQPARVTFGQGWVREGAVELFAEAVALYPPLLPLMSDHPPEASPPGSTAPGLAELRLHMGTLWPWNRAVYDPEDGGHLRVEMRALPSGPTPVDMVANAALLLGLVAALRDDITEWLSAMPFRYAEYNFYRAAQSGLDARLMWPHRRHHRLEETPVMTLLEWLLPEVSRGLRALGVADADSRPYLAVIAERLQARTSPARWQRQRLAQLEAQGLSRGPACHRLLDAYREAAATNRPVARWPQEA
ncbi:Carboxylate-amine ligase YbdK [Halomonas sp. THAF5a]|uniref:glutamate--cysteine ligase n=1 Tax=Halomonas sp. THAF5a TaxID=2587844 RepID=UPI0012678DD4|nr:glutamate--cysteine ligase [Halomonas sp. THAF5a]QFU02880.1 Carboxylate-amine ligase YbdK [Halomonas sp. THAF5a]